MPVSPAPDTVTLRYKKVVGLGLTFQAINFAQGEFMGHRVRFNVPVDYMNQYFFWQRASGDYRPTGRFANEGRPDQDDIIDLPTFANFLQWCLGTSYTDIDGVEDALNYSSQALDTYNESKRDHCVPNFTTVEALVDAGDDAEMGDVTPETHYGANDLVMAYVLYKCFGSSAFDAEDIVYNLEDAFGMLTSKQLADAVKDSLEEQDELAVEVIGATAEPKPGQRGKVDEMFRALLAADPKRFFLKGKQIEGLFETNYVCPDASGGDPEAEGNWCLKPGDIIEIPIKLVFTAPVTVLSVVDNPREPSSLSPEKPETVVIKGEVNATDATLAWEFNEENLAAANRANIMSVRLQLLCSMPLNTDKKTFATSEVLDDAGAPAAMDFKIANQMNIVFYNSKYYPKQSAIAIVPVGGSGTYTYTCDDLPVGVELDEATGVLTFDRMDPDADPPAPYADLVSGRHAVSITVTTQDADDADVEIVVDLFITISDGTEATNVEAA
jgi:hypothetical protein